MWPSFINALRPRGLICLIALLSCAAVYALAPDLRDGPRRWALSDDPRLDALIYEIHWGDLARVRRTAAGVGNVNLHDRNGMRPPAHAVVATRPDAAEVCRLLLDFGADVNARNRLGNTPLIAAACLNRDRSTAVLLAAGADPNASNHSGVFALHVAADHPRAGPIVQMLLYGGADPLARDLAGKTPREWACAADNLHSADVIDSFDPTNDRAVVSRTLE